jgi:hypothetical protein
MSYLDPDPSIKNQTSRLEADPDSSNISQTAYPVDIGNYLHANWANTFSHLTPGFENIADIPWSQGSDNIPILPNRLEADVDTHANICLFGVSSTTFIQYHDN